MTYQEAMDNIRCALDGGCPHKYNCSANRSGKCLDKEIEESINMIKELVGKADKYKWHDLRKNPNDLPPNEDDEYLFAREDWGCNGCDRASICELHDDSCLNCWISYDVELGSKSSWDDCRVIAWREIEPFEEVIE